MRGPARPFTCFGWMTGILLLALLGCSREEPAANESTPAAAASQAAVDEAILRQVQSWGPQSTQAGTPFNRLPSGDSAFWIVSTGDPEVVIELAGKPLPTTVRDDIVTAAVPHQLVETLLAKPGELELALTSPATGRRQQVGLFRVEE